MVAEAAHRPFPYVRTVVSCLQLLVVGWEVGQELGSPELEAHRLPERHTRVVDIRLGALDLRH